MTSRQWGQKQRKIFGQRSPDTSEELKAETCQENEEEQFGEKEDKK